LPYDIDEILTAPYFEYDDVVKSIPVEDFTMDYIKSTGLTTPLFFYVPPQKLGMNMPDPSNFTVDDVLENVGRDRKIEVVEVCTQNGRLMNLSDFIDYYKKPVNERQELLNVLSLEFSSTPLADLVSAPSFVPKIDWIDNVWPKELFKRQENLLSKSSWAREQDFSTYPKVFWLIEPTEENLKLYEEWILGGSNNSCFFGKIVNKCTRLFLKQGATLIIPSGWIHCVYTPCDSLVFGGNFLHSFSMPMQIRVSRSEDRIKIGSKYRFPHFKQIFWCYLAKVVKLATGRVYQKMPTVEAFVDKEIDFEAKSEGIKQPEKNSEISADNIFYDNIGNSEDGTYTFNPIQLKFGDQDPDLFIPSEHYEMEYLHSLSPFEINGLHSLVRFMKRLLNSKQPEVIEGITRPAHLIMELKALLNKINLLDQLNLRKDIELFQKKSKICGFASCTIDNKNLFHEQMALNVQVPRKPKGRRNILKLAKKKQESNQPILVDGLPLPTLAAAEEPSGNGYNPIAQVVKLGHKPIASAWRRSSNMVKALPSTSVSILKRKSSDFEQPSTIESGETSTAAADSNLQIKTDLNEQPMSSAMAQSSMEIKNASDVKPVVAKKNKAKFKITRKIIEMHDDSPEFIHRSPLQRFTPINQPNVKNSMNNFEQPARVNNANWNTNVKPPTEQTQNQQSFAPRRTFNNRQRFESGSRWNDQYNNDGHDQYNNNFGGHSSFQNSPFYHHGARGQQNRFSRPSEHRRQTFEQPARANWNSSNNGKFGDNWNSSDNWDSNPKWIAGESWNSNDNWKSGDNFTSMDQSSAVERVAERANTPEKNDYFEKRNDVQIEPKHQQQPEETQPIDTAVNELHQITQIMNFPCGAYPYSSVDCVNIAHIPLPPSPKAEFFHASFTDNSVSTSTNVSSDPFTEVDQLAQLGQMMHEY
uniref:JmjC domain-containing protein n=1 Tax=Meloidogyne floridensis TaxID=298350 RepID=A0A915NIM8_9BILA